MLVSTPFLLVLLDAWPLGRFPAAGDGPGRTGVSRLLAEKLPFLALAIAAAAVTWVAQSSGGGSSAVSPIALWPRVANAVVSLVRYPAMAAWPSGLASFYPHPGTLRPDVPLLPVAAAAALVAAACALAVRDWKRRPYLAWGLGWYLVTVAPVIGVVQVGGQALADRYTYVPLVGLLVAVVWWGADGATRLRLPPLAVGALSILVVAAYAAVAWGQVGYWKDSETLHRRSLAVTERNWKAWHGLCDALAEQGRLAEALAACTRAIAALPTFPEAWNTRGVVRARMGSPGDAIPDFERAIALRPDYARAMQNLGAANGNLGRNREASAWFEAALRLRPDDPETLGYLALARALGGDASGAAEALSRLRAVDPGRAASIQARIGP
jgi:tetratricopeptide (TPR) repeat protein